MEAPPVRLIDRTVSQPANNNLWETTKLGAIHGSTGYDHLDRLLVATSDQGSKRATATE